MLLGLLEQNDDAERAREQDGDLSYEIEVSLRPQDEAYVLSHHCGCGQIGEIQLGYRDGGKDEERGKVPVTTDSFRVVLGHAILRFELRQANDAEEYGGDESGAHTQLEDAR
jgi:hypothetical protein